MLDIPELALLPLTRLFDGVEPYARHCRGRGGLPSRYRELVNCGIHGYELYTYQSLVATWFGEAAAREVRDRQLRAVGDDAFRGREHLARALDVIGIAVEMRRVTVSMERCEYRVPVEMNVALALLLEVPASPYYTSAAPERTARIAGMGMDTDWRLADCLAAAREAVIRGWIPALAHLRAGAVRPGGRRADA